jgi:hypothetical protein
MGKYYKLHFKVVVVYWMIKIVYAIDRGLNLERDKILNDRYVNMTA